MEAVEFIYDQELTEQRAALRQEFRMAQEHLRRIRLEWDLMQLPQDERDALEILDEIIEDYEAEERSQATLMIGQAERESVEGMDRVAKDLNEAQAKVRGLRAVRDLVQRLARAAVPRITE